MGGAALSESIKDENVKRRTAARWAEDKRGGARRRKDGRKEGGREERREGRR